MKAPISYYPNFISSPDQFLQSLKDELDWVRREKVPRSEYYCNDFTYSYTYGRGGGQREYHPQPYHPVILEIRKNIQNITDL